MTDGDQNQRLPAWRLFSLWANIGCFSFGGGASSILLIRRTFVEKYRLFTPEEFSRYWNIGQITPGVTQLAVSILIGKKLGGFWGAAASLTGLLLPSAILTCLLASVFLTIEHLPIVVAMLSGIVPATGGMMCWLAIKFAQPSLARDRRKRVVNGVSLVMILGSFVALAFFQSSVLVVLFACSLVGVPLFGFMERRKTG